MEEPICTAGHLSGLVHAGPREAQAEQQPAERKGLPALESSVFVLSQEVLLPGLGEDDGASAREWFPGLCSGVGVEMAMGQGDLGDQP